MSIDRATISTAMVPYEERIDYQRPADIKLPTASERDGRELYRRNPTYRNIANLMEHPEFRKMYDTHFGTPDDAKVIMMFLKVYEAVETQSGGTLTGYQKLSVMDQAINDGRMRQQLCDGFSAWASGKTQRTQDVHDRLRLT